MKPGIFKVFQFIASLLVLMECIRQLDSGFTFPWLYLISGVVMITLIPLIPVLNSKYYTTGAVIYFAQTVLLVVISLHYWSFMRKYTMLVYILTAVFMCIAGFRNIRKA